MLSTQKCPPALPKRARIGLFAPGSPPDPESLRRGIDTLEALGHTVVTLRSFDYAGYLCGPDEVRSQELNTLFRAPDLDALIAIRGGYGTHRILPDLEYGALLKHPKIVMGYSDITALHLAILRQTGLVTFLGPMVAPDWSNPNRPPATDEQCWSLLQNADAATALHVGASPLQTWHSGSADGILVGGNLTVLTSLIGTPFMPSLDGCILVLEDVSEPPYRLDALLTQLRHAGHLDNLAGLVLGQFTHLPDDAREDTLDVWRRCLDSLKIPVLMNLSTGHIDRMSTLPLGAHVRLEATSRTASLTLVQPVVAPRRPSA